MKTKQKRTKLIGWVGGGVLVVALLIGGLWIGRQGATAETDVQSGDIVAVFVGDLAANATASGQLEVQQQSRLALSRSGIVDIVLVEVGDVVAAGDPLLQLDTGALERAVTNAQQTVTIQEANLATLLAPASAADLAAAQAAVVNAQTSLADLLAGPSEDEIAAAEADVRAATADVAAAAARSGEARSGGSASEIEAAQIELQLAQTDATLAAERHSGILVTEPDGFLTQERLADMEFSARTAAVQANGRLAAAQDALDQLVNGDGNSIASTQAGLAQSVAQRDAAQARLDLLLAAAPAAQIASAEASVTQAEANLDKLRRGPAAFQITQMEVAVEQARIGLQRAEHDLAAATLLAPFGGVVTAVHVNPGEMANGILIEIINNDSLEVVLAVDEVDMDSISVGQAAILQFESLPDRELNGVVAAIAPQANNDDSALVTYDVYLGFDQSNELPLRAGLTADARLLTDSVTNVLLLPNGAIQADREAGTFNVNLVQKDENGQQAIVETAVSIGLRDNQYTQIVDGLQAGDEILIGNVLPVLRFGPGSGNTPNDGGPFGE